MRMTVLAAVASFALASGAGVMQASAADLFEPAPAPVPAPILHDWSGFYVGGHVGYGEGDITARATVWSRDGIRRLNHGEALDPNGLVGGVHGGFNWQVGTWVLGVEGDVSFVDWNDSFTHTETFDTLAGPVELNAHARSQVDFLASVRGRLGIAFDTLLIYGTGGIAFADADSNIRVVRNDTEIFNTKLDFDDVGWVFGGGAEWAVIPNRFSIGAEGLWYAFDDRQTVREEFEGEAAVRATSKFHDAWVARARANFHF